MPEDRELVPREGELVATDARPDAGLHEVFTKMSELLQLAVLNFQLQNVREVDTVARTGAAMYDASKRDASPDELLLLGILRNLISLYAPLTRAVVFQMEGHFTRAREDLANGIATSNDSIAAIEQYERLPDADTEVLQVFKPVLLIFPILFRGLDAWIRADMVGYQGDIPHYRELLREAVKEFRKAERLPSSLNPMSLALVSFCSSFAERLETRIDVFGSYERKHFYLRPTGDKIFIIHGHDEAKWRELRDVLTDELNQKTTVLKEEPGASETLISKFEEFADDCCYAFALLTPDDFVEREGESYFQARPNVLFELGWFYGRYGPDRVCFIKKAKTEMPSDLAGILSIDFQNDVSEGLGKIQAELRRAGIIAGGTRRSTRRSKRAKS